MLTYGAAADATGVHAKLCVAGCTIVDQVRVRPMPIRRRSRHCLDAFQGDLSRNMPVKHPSATSTKRGKCLRQRSISAIAVGRQKQAAASRPWPEPNPTPRQATRDGEQTADWLARKRPPAHRPYRYRRGKFRVGTGDQAVARRPPRSSTLSQTPGPPGSRFPVQYASQYRCRSLSIEGAEGPAPCLLAVSPLGPGQDTVKASVAGRMIQTRKGRWPPWPRPA